MPKLPEPKNPDFHERILEQLTRQEFMKLTHCRLVHIDVATVIAEIELSKVHKQQSGLTHGGVVALIADVAAGFAGFTLIGADQQLVTAELKISYFLPAVGAILRAVGKVVKHGNTLSFCEADVYSVNVGSDDVLVARATATMAIVKGH